MNTTRIKSLPDKPHVDKSHKNGLREESSEDLTNQVMTHLSINSTQQPGTIQMVLDVTEAMRNAVMLLEKRQLPVRKWYIEGGKKIIDADQE